MRRESTVANGNIGQSRAWGSGIPRFVLAATASGFGMWVVGGLWHNLLLPMINENAKAHHDGLLVALAAYILLASLMTYLFLSNRGEGNPYTRGALNGMVVGILWVLPHGLVMAGAHQSSMLYEIKNAAYHVVEQGIGGIIIAMIWRSTIAAEARSRST